ncbi:MAG: DUF4266 domain-containing protein [Alteromonadaceae bacterium]|nr:DUF4266 domain-containing protein [Alteromonadaceae bacterium]
MKRLLTLAMCLCLTACASVKPWERGRFAKQEMNFEPDAMQAAFERHVYFSKEASSGGTSNSGGGCGCN